MKRVIVVGSGGQDGRLLFDLLVAEKASVVGIERTRVRAHRANVDDRAIDLRDHQRIATLLGSFQPDEVYYLAAHHAAADHRLIDTAKTWRQSFEVHVYGLLGFLEGIRARSRRTRVFYAASSLVFGHPSVSPQNEGTPLEPRSPYAISKAAGVQICRDYRERESIFASVGILYNHESSLRPDAFVSQKIVRGALRIRAGQKSAVILGDLSAQVDWGSATDFVRAMRAIVRADAAEDFIVATGQLHTVADFARVAFEEVGLCWQDYVRISDAVHLERRAALVGDSTKLRTVTGWCPSVTFEELVRSMVAEQRRYVQAVT